MTFTIFFMRKLNWWHVLDLLFIHLWLTLIQFILPVPIPFQYFNSFDQWQTIFEDSCNQMYICSLTLRCQNVLSLLLSVILSVYSSVHRPLPVVLSCSTWARCCRASSTCSPWRSRMLLGSSDELTLSKIWTAARWLASRIRLPWRCPYERGDTNQFIENLLIKDNLQNKWANMKKAEW